VHTFGPATWSRVASRPTTRRVLHRPCARTHVRTAVRGEIQPLVITSESDGARRERATASALLHRAPMKLRSLRSTSARCILSTALALALPLAACDVEPETGPDDPRAELADEALADENEVDEVDADDAGLEPGADALAAADDPSAIAPGFPIEIEIVGNDVVLTWPQIQDATLYQVDSGQSPYFQPGPYAPIGYSYTVGFVWGNFQPQHQFVHVGAAANATNYNYRVAAFNAPGLPRGFSSTVMKVAQPLVAGANLVSFSLVDASVDDTASLHAALGGFSGPLGQVTRFDAYTQTFHDWNPWSGQPGFDIDTGDALFVHTLGAGSLVMVGHAPAEDGEATLQLVPGWNLVSAPLDIVTAQNAFQTPPASEIASTIGPVSQLAEWNPATQSYVSYQYPSGWGTNFTVQMGQPIWVEAIFPFPWD
jgi:hypothetical protein